MGVPGCCRDGFSSQRVNQSRFIRAVTLVNSGPTDPGSTLVSSQPFQMWQETQEYPSNPTSVAPSVCKVGSEGSVFADAEAFTGSPSFAASASTSRSA